MNETTPPTEWRFPRRARSVRLARARLREQAAVWGLPVETTETAVLLLSELLTNAVRHARVPPDRHVAARAVLTGDRLRVEVCDASDTHPRPRAASPEDESGRGLGLVEALADAWDVRPRPYGIGKTVWFELRVVNACAKSSDPWPETDVLFPVMESDEGLLNVIDVEATCWDGEPPPGAVSEIIEIGLTVVDLARGERVARHRILVRPTRSQVSDFCTELTGLTQAEVDQGVDFADACKLLAAEHHAGPRAWASWGDYDRHQFNRQCRATGTTYPFGSRHINVKTLFTQAHGLAKRPGMVEALQIAGLPLEGRHHCGEHDSWNIAALALALTRLGAWPGLPGR